MMSPSAIATPLRLLGTILALTVGIMAACAGFVLAIMAQGTWRLSLRCYRCSERFLGFEDDVYETDLGGPD
jgi:hypothetical protein